MKMQAKLLTLVTIGTVLMQSCAPKGELQSQRADIKDLSAMDSSAANIIVSPLVSAVQEPQDKSACARVNELAARKLEAPAGRFSYLGSLHSKDRNGGKSFSGSIALNESPFSQFVLGESFQVDDDAGFYEKAKKEHDAGNIGGMKWFLVKFMKFMGLLSIVKYSATNDKLNEAFPGMFGEESPMDGSLHWSLARKAANINALSTEQIQAALTKKLPLFSADGSWSSWAEDSRENLTAAVKALNSDAHDEASEKERLCALTLMHQNFASLLSLRGFVAPEMQAGAGGTMSMVKLSSSHSEFAKKQSFGGFFDQAVRQSVVLTNDGIQQYDPSAKFMPLTKNTPNGLIQKEAGTVSDGLAAMEALLYAFEASSPASPWIKDAKDYRFGDVTNAASPALLPAEAHALSLGLLTVQFKNLAALYLKKVNARGQELRAGESAAGIMVVSGEGAHGASIVKLDDIMRFAQVVSYLENALKRFSTKGADEWAAMNPVYSRKTLAALMGKAMFSDDELSKLLSPAERANVLKDNLKLLKLPLALLLSQLGSDKACVSELEWNLQTGERRPLGACSAEQEEKLAEVFGVMARDTGAPVLLRRAEKLRQAAIEHRLREDKE